MRVKTTDGDWYMATDSASWDKAFNRMQRSTERRHARMARWEAKQPAGARFEPGYWEHYRREKYRTPIEYPMPVGHIMFKGQP